LFGKAAAIAQLVGRIVEAADDLFLCPRERRFLRHATGAIQNAAGNTETGEIFHVSGGRR